MKEIPGENNDFIHQLESLKSSISYSSPELIPLRWKTFTEIFNTNIPFPPQEEWHFKVISIFIDKTIDEVKEMFKNNQGQ